MKTFSSGLFKNAVFLGIGFLMSTWAIGQSTNSATTSTTNAPPLVAPADSTPPSDGVTSDAIIKKATDTYAALKSYSDSGTANSKMGSFGTSTTFTIRLQRPGFYNVSWQSTMSQGVVWSDGTGDYLQAPGIDSKKQTNREMALAGATGISGGVAASIPGTFFAEKWGDKLSGAHERKADEKVDGVDCYVLTSTINRNGTNLLTTLWIGQQDSLIHQTKTKMDGMPKMPVIDDATLTKILNNQNKPVTPEALDALRKQLSSAQDMAATMMKGGGIEFTELHTNIVTDKTFNPDDFKPAKS
jgi:outer membrane lipoprotein-sorting protein